MLNLGDIMETIKMIQNENLDIRTLYQNSANVLW